MARTLRNLMGAGIGAQAASLLNGLVADNLTATGSVQGDALALPGDVNVLSVVPTGSGVRLPALPQPGDETLIANLGANALTVYPPPGANIEGGATNAPFSLPSGASAEFIARVGSSNWISLASGVTVTSLTAPVLTRTSSAGTNPPTWDASLPDLHDGDTIELYYTTDGSTPTATGSPQGTHTAVATEETINWGAAWPASFTGGATVKWAERYGRNPGTGMIWSPLSNVLSDVMPSTPWNPNPAPAGQNLGFVTTATFASENFLTGLGIVIVSVDNGQPSGVTVGGSAAAPVKTSNATGVRSVSIWKIATTAGAKNVVISGSGIAGIAIITGTLVGMNSTETATGAEAYAFGADPQTTGSITCPAGGVVLAGLISEADGNAPTWTTGTLDCDVRVSGRLRHTTAHLSATGAPTVTGYNGSGSGMAAAAWGP